jgi:hypothetical protein
MIGTKRVRQNAGETMHPSTFTPADSARLVNEHLTAFASALVAQSANAAAQADSTLKLLRDRSLTAAASQIKAPMQHSGFGLGSYWPPSEVTGPF